MDIAYIEQLMKMMDTHHMDLLRLKEGEQEIVLERKAPAASPVWVPAPAATPPSLPTAAPSPVASQPVSSGTFITSPMVGTFYSAASPDVPPFVTIGSKIEPQTVICIVEAMKVMNEVKSGVSGVIAEVLVKNGDPIEFGTKLFRVT